MWNIISRRKRFLADASGLATIEFALAGTALTVGLLNGLEVARWSLQKMEMANAVHSATLAVWNACDTKHLPAITKCSGLNSAISTGLQTTSLGTAVTLATNYPQEGYYCLNTSGVLIKAAAYNAATIPSNCGTWGDSTHAPGDYVLVQATYSYTPLVSSGLTVGSILPATFTSTGWIRLK